MSGSLLGKVCAAALVAVTVVALAPPAGAVDAAEEPPPGGTVGRVLGDLGDNVAEALAGAGPVADPGALAGAPGTAAGIVARVRQLYREAADAERTVAETTRALTARRAGNARLARDLAEAREALRESRAAAGRIAGEQYRTGGSELSAPLRLLLAGDPRRALEQSYLIERASAARRAALTGLEAAEHRARTLAADSRTALDAELALVARQQKAKATAVARLRSAEALLAALPPDELAGLSGEPSPSPSTPPDPGASGVPDPAAPGTALEPEGSEPA
ncbi:hypothetical protein [Streptomyces sp. NPDC005805]|uniref:hypothetical protein n=1 Tax=Streptomyces sp. NPDC005805 TaxID=3157068 RepID=UPI0034015968